MARVTITLRQDERQALIDLAQQERRDPRQQAAIIIQRELERMGYLQSPPTKRVCEVRCGES
jgi:hypothetical protein